MGVEELVSKTIKSIEGSGVGSEAITFELEDGTKYSMYHSQDCCESVRLEDVAGDLSDLIGSPIVRAEESSDDKLPAKDSDYTDSYTWTFYRIGTAKGLVVFRWYGTSNGYYSERVDFEKVENGS